MTSSIIFNDSDATKPYTREEEAAIFTKLRAEEPGSDEYNRLCNEIAVHNLRLVWSVAHTIHMKTDSRRDLDDLFQAGYFGLIRAIEKFDLSFDTRFSTYAVNWIRQAISRYISDEDTSVSVPSYLYTTVNKINSIRLEILQKTGHAPTNEEVAEKLPFETDRTNYGVPSYMLNELSNLENKKNKTETDKKAAADLKARIINMRCRYINWIDQLAAGEVSLNTYVGSSPDSDGTELGDFFADTAPTPEEYAMDICQQNELMKVITQVLNPREQFVIYNRFGFNRENKIYTLEEIAKPMHITRERVRQIEAISLRKIRTNLARRGITGADSFA